MTENTRLVPQELLNDSLAQSDDASYKVIRVEFIEAEDEFSVYRVIFQDKNDSTYWAGLNTHSHHNDCDTSWCNEREGGLVEIYRVLKKEVRRIEYVDISEQES